MIQAKPTWHPGYSNQNVKTGRLLERSVYFSLKRLRKNHELHSFQWNKSPTGRLHDFHVRDLGGFPVLIDCKNLKKYSNPTAFLWFKTHLLNKKARPVHRKILVFTNLFVTNDVLNRLRVTYRYHTILVPNEQVTDNEQSRAVSRAIEPYLAKAISGAKLGRVDINVSKLPAFQRVLNSQNNGVYSSATQISASHVKRART